MVNIDTAWLNGNASQNVSSEIIGAMKDPVIAPNFLYFDNNIYIFGGLSPTNVRYIFCWTSFSKF